MTMINGIDPRIVGVTARLTLRGHAEFLGVHHHVDRPPTATLRICGIEIDIDRAEAERLAAAAQDMLAALTTATNRGLRAHNEPEAGK